MSDSEYIFYWKNGKLLKFKKKPLIRDITKDFIENSTPNQGNIEFAPDFDYAGHKSEIDTAYWLVKNFGGNIYLNQEDDSNKHKGISNPDYVWNGAWWDLKEPTSKNALDKRVQDGIHQVCENKEHKVGGIIVDLSDSNLKDEEALQIISYRLKRSYKKKMKAIVKRKDTLIKIIEAKR